MRTVGAFLVVEFRHVLPPTLFFLVGFNLIVLTTQLLARPYGVAVVGFLLATTSALVVGKAVLVADKMPFLRRFDGAPLWQPILFKTMVYWVFVFLARLLEELIRFLFSGEPGGFLEHVQARFDWHRFIAVQLWIFVLFLLYVSAGELNALFGDGELAAILFRRRSSELKQTRRQRIRTLVQLSRITDAHTADELRDPSNPAHGEVLGLLGALARRPARLPVH